MVTEVTPEAVREKLASDEAVTVVDIRSPGDFASGHVPGAVNLPLTELPREVGDREWDTDEIVCVCAIGESSIQAARLLGSYEGIDSAAVASMEGGYRAWDGTLVDGDPARTGDGVEPRDGVAAGGEDDPSAPF